MQLMDISLISLNHVNSYHKMEYFHTFFGQGLLVKDLLIGISQLIGVKGLEGYYYSFHNGAIPSF